MTTRAFDPSTVMARDAHVLQRAFTTGKIDASLNRRFDESQQTVADRRSSVPAISFPSELPITDHIEEISDLIAANPVVIVAGETGSGKTTQLPKACLAAGLGVRGLIGHTQPRRLAARTVAERIATELEVPLGEQVGYAVRFADKWSPRSLVKIMTDGLLLNEIQSDRYLNAYDAIIVDEAHERSLNVDFLLGYLRSLQHRRSDLKLIVTSATIDVDAFSEHFSGAPIVSVSGRGYPVETRYRPPLEGTEEAFRGCLEEIRAERRAGPRDVLVFVSGEREILEWSHWLKREFRDVFEVLPLYARLPQREQRRIFAPGGRQRVVLATNVAETSITVPNIGYVIDHGFARISRYSFRSKLQRLPIEPVSQASADQRQGRCGRVAPGVCYRLFDESDFEGRPRYTDPELKRTNLASVVLQMRAFRLGEIETFGFMDPPDPRAVSDAVRLLHELGALKDDKLTRMGRTMARLPIDPRLARIIIAADKQRSLNEILIIVAALAMQDPRTRPLDKQQAADKAHEPFVDDASDFLSFVKLWHWAENVRGNATRSGFRRALERSFVSPNRMGEWRALHRQLLLTCRQLGLVPNKTEADYASVHRALIYGSLGFVGLKNDRGEYQGPRGLGFRIFPGSALASKRPKWIVAAEIADTGRTYARCVAQVEARWVEEAAPHLIKRSYSAPQWDERRGEVIALERATVYGLPIVEKRRVRYDTIDPVICREIFVHDALVKPSKALKQPFLANNQNLIREILQMQAKGRRVDLLASEEAQSAFYLERLPPEVSSIKSFESWYSHADRGQAERLNMTMDDLLVRSDVHLHPDAFPSELELYDVTLRLKYRFAPGEPDDGVSMRVPIGLLPHVRQEPLDWLVRGFFEEKCVELLKALPKHTRKRLAPVPDRVAEMLPLLLRDDRFRQGKLLVALGQAVSDLFAVSVPATEWRIDSLSAFLRMNVQAIDRKGRVIDQDRDVNALKLRLQQDVDERLDGDLREKHEQTEISEFPQAGLADTILIKEKGIQTVAYPVLIDNGSSVDLKLMSDQRGQLDQTRRALCRLALLTERQSARFIKKEVAKEKTMPLHYATLGSKDELIDELCRAASWHAYFEGQTLPATKADFEQLLQDRRGRLVSSFLVLVDLARGILARRFDVATAIANLSSKAFVTARDDLQAQLDLLVPARFLTLTPVRHLEELTRYLDAMSYRIDHLQGRVAKDTESIAKARAWRERLDCLVAESGPTDETTELRFLLEEYRVALFSQRVGTKEKVSDKRLSREFEPLEVRYGLR